jgi:hypothetical protein
VQYVSPAGLFQASDRDLFDPIGTRDPFSVDKLNKEIGPMKLKVAMLPLFLSFASTSFANDSRDHSKQVASQQAQITQLQRLVGGLSQKLSELETQLKKKDDELKASIDQNTASLSQRIETKVPLVAGGNTCISSSNGHRLCMQDDGNLVVYNPSSAPIFDTWGLNQNLSNKVDKNAPGNNCIRGGDFSLCMQSDANLVIYGPTGAVWSRF